MDTTEIDRVFQELVNDNALMDKIKVDRKKRYVYRNPQVQATGLAKKLEVLYLCGRLKAI